MEIRFGIITGDTKQHHGVQWGDALRILERSGVIAQAVLTKIYRQRIPDLREAIEDLSKVEQRRASTGWTSLGPSKKWQKTTAAWQPLPRNRLRR
jgi:hypothetical protein